MQVATARITSFSLVFKYLLPLRSFIFNKEVLWANLLAIYVLKERIPS